jgi:hypothetical protein
LSGGLEEIEPTSPQHDLEGLGNQEGTQEEEGRTEEEDHQEDVLEITLTWRVMLQ